MLKITSLTSLFISSLFVSALAVAEQSDAEDAIPEPVIVLTELTGNIILKNGELPETLLQLLIENESNESYSGTLGFAGAEAQKIMSLEA